MAKHKQPKNDKHKARKDLKDYTVDKEVEGMVPNASGEPLPEVPRKDDKPIIDDVDNMVPKVKDSDKIYVTKELQDGDPKMPAHALKTLVKNQQEDAEELINTLSKKDGGYMTQIEKLTKEQKEKLVREIVKRKVAKFIVEQDEKEKEEPETQDAATDVPDAAENPPADATTEPPVDTTTQPETQDATATTTEPETPDAAAATTDTEAEPEAEPEEEPDSDTRVANFVTAVQQKQNFIQQIQMVMKVINKLLKADDASRKKGKLTFLNRVIKRAIEKQ